MINTLKTTALALTILLQQPLFAESNFIKSKQIIYDGKFASWQEAVNDTTGYNAKSISEFTLKNNSKWTKMINKNDNLNKNIAEFRYIALSHLKSEVDKSKQDVKILDIGGNGGGFFSMYGSLFSTDKIKQYTVVENKNLVDTIKHLEQNPVKFIDDIKKIKDQYDVVLILGTIQYLENYQEILKYVFNVIKPKAIIFDRTPLQSFSDTFIATQHVERTGYYNGSYPLYIFNKNNFIQLFTNANYKLRADYANGSDKIQIDNGIKWKVRFFEVSNLYFTRK